MVIFGSSNLQNLKDYLCNMESIYVGFFVTTATCLRECNSKDETCGG